MNVSCAKRNETRLEQQILTPNKFGRLKATGSNYNSPNNAYFMNAREKSHVALYHSFITQKNWLIRLINADKRMSSRFRKIRFEFAEYFQNLASVMSGQSG